MRSDEVIAAEVVDQSQVDQPPVQWREILTVLLLVALSDVTIYRGHGFAGCAVLFGLAPFLLVFGAPQGRALCGQRHVIGLWIVGFLLAVLSVKLLWCGSALQVATGLILLMAFALALSGVAPYVLEIVVFPSRMMLGGLLALAHYSRSARRPGWGLQRVSWLSVVLPIMTFLAFGILFVLANPDLLASFGQHIERFLRSFRECLIHYAPHPTEMLFWLAVAWIAMGLLRPLIGKPLFDELAFSAKDVTSSPAPLYAACRNTLITVIALFAIYLVFEFKTLWFRVFPDGFYYSGYAHQGAAWLTVALALATVVLSLVFRGSVRRDPRVRSLRNLAWIWSLENVCLAIAVYHRLSIYVGFNGMTRMRIVGFLGISAVLVGFLLVVWKIAHNRAFVWLARRHLWTVAFAVYLFAVMPVDTIVVKYNVQRILAGDPAPSVQITEHPISSEGVLLLQPLMDCDDALIREGVLAHLAERLERAEEVAATRRVEGWTSYQLADDLVLAQLRRASGRWVQFKNADERAGAWNRFRHYAYQWY